MSGSKVGHNNNREEGRGALSLYRVKAICVCREVGGSMGMGVGWWGGAVVLVGSWKDVVLGQTLDPSPLRRCTEGWRDVRMDGESKVDSSSSLLEIISSSPHCTPLHT